jgi:hypothetical protein
MNHERCDRCVSEGIIVSESSMDTCSPAHTLTGSGVASRLSKISGAII